MLTDQLRRFKRLRTEAHWMRDCDMNRGAVLLLGDISELTEREGRDAVRVSEIAAWRNVPMSGVSRGLAALEEKGFIERSIGRSDRRNTLVALTEAGRTELDAIRSHREKFLSRILCDVTDEEMTTLISITDKLYRAIEREVK